MIDRLVSTVKRYTTRPLVVVARLVVFGILAAAISLVIGVLLVIGATRALQSLGDVWFDHGTSVWLSYMLLGAAFVAIGGILMRRRRPPAQ
jgi:hypothetical protein